MKGVFHALFFYVVTAIALLSGGDATLATAHNEDISPSIALNGTYRISQLHGKCHLCYSVNDEIANFATRPATQDDIRMYLNLTTSVQDAWSRQHLHGVSQFVLYKLSYCMC